MNMTRQGDVRLLVYKVRIEAFYIKLGAHIPLDSTELNLVGKLLLMTTKFLKTFILAITRNSRAGFHSTFLRAFIRPLEKREL